MTSGQQFEQRVADLYTADGTQRAPDRVLLAALTTIETTPQRRVLARAPWRLQTMPSSMRLAIAAVAIVAVTAFAITRLFPIGGVGTSVPTPIPTGVPTPSSTPSPTPSEAPAVALPGGGRALSPGRYAIQVPDSVVRVELTVSEPGWDGNETYLGGRMSLSFWTVGNVYGHACLDSSLPEPSIGPTVDDLVAAFDAQAGTDMQAFAKPIVGGYPSTRVIMRPSEGMAAACPGGLLKLWQAPDGADGRAISTTVSPDGQEDVIWIVDVAGHRVVIVGYYDPSDTVQATAILEIIDSIAFVVP
jgi:hypothetical protein